MNRKCGVDERRRSVFFQPWSKMGNMIAPASTRQAIPTFFVGICLHNRCLQQQYSRISNTVVKRFGIGDFVRPRPSQRSSGTDFVHASMCRNHSVVNSHTVDPVWDSQSKMGHHFLPKKIPATSFSYLLKKLQTMSRDILGISFIILGIGFCTRLADHKARPQVHEPGAWSLEP